MSFWSGMAGWSMEYSSGPEVRHFLQRYSLFSGPRGGYFHVEEVLELEPSSLGSWKESRAVYRFDGVRGIESLGSRARILPGR